MRFATRRPVFLTLILAVALPPAVSAGAPTDQLQQWRPSESYAGGKQFDPRLDTPVRFWLTGAPLARVFSSIRDQTGVEIGFFPPGDDNARICVNLYLNPQQPPSLRDLMAQLAWVTDCSFEIRTHGEAQEYALLSTTIASHALARQEAEMDRLRNEEDVRKKRADWELWQKALARLPELKQALELSREEATRKYRDDPMLLTLLDPARRAAAKFMLSLSTSQLAQIGPDIGERVEWADLTAEQRACLKEAMQPWLTQYATRKPEHWAEFPWDDWARAEQTGLTVAFVGRPTGLNLEVEPTSSFMETHGGAEVVGIPSPVLVADAQQPDGMCPNEAVALRRLLEGPLGPEEEARLEQEARMKADEHYRDEWQRKVESSVARLRRLSSDGAAQLAAVQLPLHEDTPYALWQLQEAAAVLSGFSVISDCFWQPARDMQHILALLHSDADTENAADAILTAACVNYQDPMRVSLNETTLAWEWGDAGNLLRFRSVDRAVWREALWPSQTLEVMNGWLEPHLPDPKEIEGELEAVTVPVDPRVYSLAVTALDSAQYRYGRSLVYADPTDPREAYRTAFRAQLLGAIGERVPCRVISVLDEERWERLRREGLVWGKDVALKPTPLDLEVGWWDYHDGDVLHYEELTGARYPRPRSIGTSSVSRWARFWVYREGWSAPHVLPPFENRVPLALLLRPIFPAHLVPPPDAPASRGQAAQPRQRASGTGLAIAECTIGLVDSRQAMTVMVESQGQS